MTNLPMPGEAQSPANYMKQVRLNAYAHIDAHTVPCTCACVRLQVDHAAHGPGVPHTHGGGGGPGIKVNGSARPGKGVLFVITIHDLG